MKTIDTGKVKLGFIEVKDTWFDFKSRYEGKYHVLYGCDSDHPYVNPYDTEFPYECWDEEVLIPCYLEISRGDYVYHEVIGRLSEITEEQAKELGMGVPGKTGHEVHYLSEGEFNRALYSLRSAALLLGIEHKDFDKYLVVKLS